MKHIPMLALAICMAMASLARAADTEPVQIRERVYGYELMSPQERSEYQIRMRELKTEQAREAFRLEHHNRMRERVEAYEKPMPGMPPSGHGSGMGPGSGMGSGSRR